MNTLIPLLRRNLIALWQIGRNIFWVLALLFFGWVVLTLPDQAQDMIDAIGQKYIIHPIFLTPCFFVLFWSVTTWNSTRIILLSPVGVEKNTTTAWWSLWLPRFTGLVPFLIVGNAFNADQHGWHLLVIILLGFSTFYALFYKYEIKKHTDYSIKNVSKESITYITKIPISEKDNWRKHLYNKENWKADWQKLNNDPVIPQILKLTGLLYLAIFLLFLIPLFYPKAGLAFLLGSTSIFIAGISLVTIFGSLVLYFSDLESRPLTLITILIIFFCSLFNDNTHIRQFEDREPNRAVIYDQIGSWVKARIETDSIQNDTIPFVLIAAEGGGTRALNWTLRSLTQLNKIIPDFDKYTFAISGVSGGGVGATFYLANKYDFLKAERDNAQWESNQIKDPLLHLAAQEDFLAPVTAGLVFNEPIQAFIPFGISALERTKRLEDSWSVAFSKYLRSDTFEKPLTALYTSLPFKQRYQLPSLLLNGTVAETGQKAITTNLSLEAQEACHPNYFSDVIEVLKFTGKDMPVKTAASMCSRFPFITNGGLIQKISSNKAISSAHITDGGYFDNTGIETLIQLLNTLKPIIKGYEKRGLIIKPYVFFLQNSEMSFNSNINPITSFKELLIPLSSFYNPWDRGSFTKNEMFSVLLQRDSLGIKYTNIKMTRAAQRVPLGWYMSENAVKYIQLQVEKDITLDTPGGKLKYPFLKELQEDILKRNSVKSQQPKIKPKKTADKKV